MSDYPDTSTLSQLELNVTPALIHEIVDFVSAQKIIDETVISELRNDYPNLRFTMCYDTEMGSRDAYAEYEKFDLHLVAHSSVGCSGLTLNLEACTGFVIAVHDE